MPSMNTGTHHCIMLASGDRTKYLRLVCPLVVVKLTLSLFKALITFVFSQDLVTNGALVSICNKYGETPMDKAKPHLRELLKGVPQIDVSASRMSFWLVALYWLSHFSTIQRRLRKWARPWLKFPSRTVSGKAPPEPVPVSPTNP